MNYEKMSDFEINKSVAVKLGVFWHVKPCNSETGGWVYSENYEKCNTSIGEVAIELPDYCNNPSDAWPIIMENNISMRPMYIRDADGRKLVEWEAIHVERDFPRESFGWDDKNPLRAAMIVFLMMQEAKRG